MLDFKNEIADNLNKNIYANDMDKLRSGYKGKFGKERFKEYFVKKTVLHMIFKYIFIRMMSEGKKLVSPKLNNEGIAGWNEMTKNYRGDYLMLFKIACEDLRRNKETNEFFEPCIYDNYMDKLEHGIFNKRDNNCLEKLMGFDFGTFDPNTAVSLFDNLYPGEEREILQTFLEESKITTYLLESLGLL